MDSVRQQREISQLINQNHILKARLAKLGQIQSYIDVLVSNNKNYQEEISILQSQNRKLRNHIQQQVAKRLHQQSSHQSQMNFLKKNYDSQINGLLTQLKSILKDRQQMQFSHKSIIDQLKVQYSQDIASKLNQIQQVDIEYQNKINKLNNIVRQQQKDLDLFSRQLKQAKIQHLQQVDILNAKIRFINQSKTQFQAQTNKNHKQIELLSKQVKQLNFQNEQISTKCLTIQQQKNDIILELKKQNKKLIAQLDKISCGFKNLQLSFQQSQIKVNSLTSQYQDLRRQRNQLQTEGRKCLRIIQQNQYILSNTRQKLKSQEEVHYKQDKRNKQIIQQLQKINFQLKKKLDQSNRQNTSKTEQIKDLLTSVQKIQLKMSHIQKQNSKLVQTNMKNKQQIHYQQSRIEESELQIRSLRQKLALYQSHNTTLQQMIQKQKRRSVNLQIDRRDISKIADVERDISKKYQIQIKRLIHQFELQRNGILQQHNLERERLKQLYEYTLANKEDLFNRKLELLESQIQTLRVGII